MTTPPPPRSCLDSEINDNASFVRSARSTKLYAPVPVTIDTVDSASGELLVDFYARPQDPATGLAGPPKLISKVPWNDANVDIWTKCPSSVPEDPPGSGKPTVGATATLYIERRMVDDYDLYWTPKWPNSLPSELSAPATVWPTSVIVDGYLLRGGELTPGTVDLLDPRHALTVQSTYPPASEPPQQLVLNGGAVTLSLTPLGFNECFGHAFPIERLRRAVLIVQEVADARSMADAWRTIAMWVDLTRTRPDLVTDEARRLLNQVRMTRPPER